MATPSSTSKIVYDIIINAQQASAELKKFGVAFDQTAQKAVQAKKLIQQVSKSLGVSFSEAAQIVGKFNPMLGITQNQLNKTAAEMQNVGNKGKSAFDKVLSSTNVLNIAFGILASTLIRSVLQAFSDTFTKAISQARQLEETLFRLANVERQLSLEGIEISMEGMQEGITALKEALPIFSREDISQLVGGIAVTTKELKLTENQMLKLAAAVAILNVNSTDTETLLQTQARISNSLISPQARSIGDLGLSFGKAKIEAKAFELQILKAGESFINLTEKEKTDVKYSIILETAGIENLDNVGDFKDAIENAGGSLDAFNDFMETNTSKIQKNEAAWRDLLTTIGQGINNLIPDISGVLEWIQDSIEITKLQSLFKETINEQGLGSIINPQNVSILYKLSLGIKLTTEEYEKLKSVLSSIPQDAILKIFPDPSAIKNRFTRELVQSIVKFKDTQTGAPRPDKEDQESARKHGEKLAEIMQDNADKLADIARDLQRKLEDIARDTAEKRADLARKNAQQIEDAERDFAQKNEDINRDAAEKVAEAQQDFRQKEIDREQEYQNKLRELREKFLFDLEDALRARDARQVLRLIRQFNMDKKSLEERRKQQKKEDTQDLQQKLQDIERERVLKLEAAKREHEQKLADLALSLKRESEEISRWNSRALADARLWHQRQLAEQREYLARKLADLRQAYAQELNMASSFQNSLGSLTQQSAGTSLTPASTSYGGGFPTLSPGVGSGNFNPYDVRTIYQQMGIPQYADGGTLVANKPTLALFGEKSPERVDFTPINKGGFNASFGSSGAGAAGGELSLNVSLSEGLIAEIVNSSLERVATHIENTRRSR